MIYQFIIDKYSLLWAENEKGWVGVLDRVWCRSLLGVLLAGSAIRCAPVSQCLWTLESLLGSMFLIQPALVRPHAGGACVW